MEISPANGDVERGTKLRIWLVVWLPFFISPYFGNFIIPIDFHILQRGGQTTNQGFMNGEESSDFFLAKIWNFLMGFLKHQQILGVSLDNVKVTVNYIGLING